MAIARIADDQIAEQRADITLADVPEHKRVHWKPIEGDPPPYVPGAQYITGPVYVIEPTRVLRQWTVHDHALADVKTQYKAKVDDDAEAVRLRYITPGAGQAMTYREKFDQAEAVNALGQAAADAMTQQEYEQSYPVLSASVGIEAETLWQCAQLVIQRYVAFNLFANLIERTRLQAKKAITEAVDGPGVVAAYEAIQWTV